MATVFVGRDIRHDRTVAVKVLHPDLAAAIGKERFLREVQITARFNHPHILPLLDSGEHAGLLYYIMPFVTGESLRARLDRSGALPIEEAVRFADEISEALGYAHSKGIVHRDIKPDNILLEGGHAIVVDFGIARAVDEASSNRVTLTGMAIGTPQYMSPEQMEGQPNIDPRSDLYSLGCVLFEMLVGAPPYSAPTTQALMARRMTERAPSVRHSRDTVSSALDTTVQRALSLMPADRFSSAEEMSQALRQHGSRAVPVPVEKRIAGRSSKRRAAVAVIALLVVSVAIGVWWTQRPANDEPAAVPDADAASIAVLPFVNASADTANEYFADGLTDELITTLSSVQGLKVASRTSSFAFKKSDVDIKEIGRKLGVKALLEGSVRRSDGRIRISARLVGASDGYQQWAQSYERDLNDVLAVQEEIATAIVDRLQGSLSGRASTQDSTPPPGAEAYDLYLRGRFFRNKRTADGIERAIAYFRQAIERAPRFARAYSGLAESYAVQGFYGIERPRTVFPLAKQSATEALRLDGRLGAAHATLGYVALYFDWDWPRAHAEFQRAVTEEPGYATAHQWYGNYFTAMGRFDDAERAMRQAQELDPLATITHAAVGWMLYHKGDYPRAVRELRSTIELDSSFALTHLWLGQTLEVMNRLDESVQSLRRAAALAPLEPAYNALLARTLARRGDRDEATRILATVEAARVPPSFEIAKAYLALGDRRAALRWLERAYEERSHSMVLLLVDPQLGMLRGDEDFRQLAQRVGLQ